MKRLTQILLVAALVTGSSNAMAQTRDRQFRVPVTIIVTQPETLPRFGHLTEFTAKLLELQLAQDGFARVSRAQEEPPCVVAPRDSPNNTARASLDTGRTSDMYTLVIALHNEKTSGSGADVRVDFRLVRLRSNCERTELFQHSESFPESEVLENLTLTAEILSLKLESAVVTLPVVQLSMDVTGSTVDQNPVAQELASRILRDLFRSGEVNARLAGAGAGGDADYYIDVKLDVTGPSLTARFTVRAPSRDPIQLPAIEGRRNTQGAFYESAAKSVVAVIDDLRYSRAAGLTTMRLAELSPEQLRSRAMMLLCMPTPQRGCVRQPPEAEPVLARLLEKTKTAEVYEWLGIAQAASGKQVAAAESFRLALGAANDAPTRTRVTQQLADSLYEGRQYDAAAAQYDAIFGRGSKGSPPPDSETYVRWARSHRLGKGGALPAAEVLIAGLANSNLPPLPLQTEFREVVGTERTPVLTNIYARLQGAISTGAAPLVDVVRRALARAHLADAEAAHGRRDFKTMDGSLLQAEGLANDLAADTGAREAMARLRGLWYRDRPLSAGGSGDDYGQAETYLRQALAWDPASSRAQFALATTYTVWPGEAGKGPHAQQALALFKRLTLDHFPTAAEYLVRINRTLNRNEETRAILEDAVKDDPTDRSALDALMDVCTDSLFAYECAASAAEKLDALEGSERDMGSQLEIAEIEVLAGRRVAASERLDRILANSTTLDNYRNVALFYQVWLKYVEDTTNEPSDLLQAWQAAVKKSVRTSWNFPGARHVLITMPPFSAQRVLRLLDMIKQME